jgi:4-carboxymuconolactone decarboxylase
MARDVAPHQDRARDQDEAPDRYERGWEILQRVSGEAGEGVIAGLREIAPDLGRYIVEFPYGDIYTRPGLDLRSRQIATVAALTALGDAQPQLRVHIAEALNVGCTRQEVIETIVHTAIYAGFPAALNAIFAAAEVFDAGAAGSGAAGVAEGVASPIGD